MSDIVRNLGEEEASASLRPSRLSDFTGQARTLENLSVFIRAAKARSEAVDHMLFYGPPGLSKTTLSRIIAEEAEVGFKSVAAPSIAKPADLINVLINLEARDVLFIDEIHRLPTIVEEVLYAAMEDYRIPIDVDEDGRPGANIIEVDVPAFTLVGATTRKGMLSQPLQDRFGMQFRLEHYPDEDLAGIVQRAAVQLGQTLTEKHALLIAQRSRGTPRIALRLLRRVRDFREDARVDYSDEFITACLDDLGVSDLGLDELDLRYLSVLRDQHNGGPVGIETIATAVSESRETLEMSVEPFLIRKGLIARTSRGRKLVED